MFDFLRKKLEEVVADINPFDNGRTGEMVRRERVQPARTVTAQRQPPSPAQTRPRPFNTGVGSFTAPTIKPVQPAAAPKVTSNPLKDISDFVAGSNEKFLGGAAKGIVNTANFIGSGFNAGEAEKRTNQFLKSTGQVDRQGISPLASDANRSSSAFKVGQGVGTGQQIATDIATTAIPGAAVEKGVRSLGLINRGLQSANRGSRIASRVAPVVTGGAVSSAVSQAKDPTQNAAQNFGTGAAIDVGTSLLGPGVSAASRLIRGTNLPRAEGSFQRYTGSPIDEPPLRSLPAQTGSKVAPTSRLLETGRLSPDTSAEMSRLTPPSQTSYSDASLGSGGRQMGLQTTPTALARSQDAQLLRESPTTYLPDNTPQLPIYNTNKVKFRDKAFRSTRSIIERQGESGRQLAGDLRGARDTQEIYLGQLEKAMPTVSKLARPKAIGRNSWTNKDFENFIDSVEGTAKPRTPDVAKAVDEWKVVAPTIRERAVNAGLDVGDLGPNYYPHFIEYDQIFKDKNMYNQAINHLVKTGQAKSAEDAIKLLSYAKDVSRNREFGNLEASRLVDLPFYDKTPNSLRNYLSSSTKRIANTETFGKGDEKALKLISNIGLEGGDTEAAKSAFDIAVGAKKYNPTSEKVSRGIRQYVTTTRLGLGALTNISQNVNTGVVTGHLRTLGAMVKQLDPKTREFVEDAGVISDTLINDMRTQAGYETFTKKVLGKTAEKLTAPFFGTVEKFNRSVAATAGRDYALRLAQRGDINTLKKLGVKGDIKNRTLNEEQQIQAARRIVEKTQFKVDPQDLPGWTDSPGGKLVAQFRTFSYNQGKFFSNEVLKPAARGNFMPLTRVLAALPLGYALYETRRMIDGRPPEEDPTKVGVESFSKIGGAGLALDIYKSLNPVGSQYLPPDRRTSMAVGAFGGPAAGIGTQAVGALSEAIQQKNTPEDESRLEGKVAVKSEDGEKYTDLTPASRFALQQIPIVGTATANRALPYKKLSEADEGKGSETSSAIKEVNKASKDKLKELEKLVGADTYAISNLSSNEKQQLLDRGVLSQDQIDQAEETVKSKRVELGLDSPKKDKTYLDKFNEAKKEYEKENKNWSKVEKSKKEKELRYLNVQKDFDNDTVGLYGMNKADVWNLVSSDQDGNRMVENILKYGDALVEAGLTKTNKYRDKYGRVNLNDPNISKAGGRGRGRKKSATGKFDYKLTGFSSGPSNSKQLYDLLKNARAKSSKKSSKSV